MSFAFWKKGKGQHGNGNQVAKAEDIFLVKLPVSTDNLENKGEDGKNKYISLKDLLPNNNYGIIFHNGLIHIEGYQYQIEQCVYAINGVVYTSEVKKHTLSAPNVDPAIHRIDLIVGGFNTNGEAITYVKEGIEGNIALKPTINPDIEIELGEILVSGNTTQPVDVTNEILYDEDETVINANGTSTIGAGSIAFLGTKAIESTLANGEKFYIERPTSVDTAGFTNLSFAIQAFSGIWQRGANLRLYFEDENNNQISNVIQVYGRNGNPYSFDSSNNLWEVITVPIANFSITGQVKRLVIEKNDGRNDVSFRMDRVILQLGTMPSSPDTTVTKTSELENDGAGTGGKYIDEARIAELLGALKFIQNRYADMTALYAGQNNQTDQNIQYVNDASGHSTVDSGYAYFEYLGTTNGNETDYRKLSEEESMDLIVQANDVLFDDSLTALGVTKVQQAIEFLSKRTNGGLMDGTFKWSNNTTIEDPGTGIVRFDTGLVGTVTEIAFDQLSDAGTDVSIHMESLNTGDRFLIFRQNDANKFTKVELTGAPIDEGGWFRVPVTVLESGAELDNNQPTSVIVSLNRQTAVEPSEIKLTPNYGLPSSTQDVVIECIGMNEQTSVAFGTGITINSQKIEKNDFGALILRANVTHDATEQYIDVTIDNGQSKVFSGVYGTVNGTPYIPATNDWENIVQPITVENDNISVATWGSTSARVDWRNIVLDSTKNWELQFKINESPLGTISDNQQIAFNLNALSNNAQLVYVLHNASGSIAALRANNINGNTGAIVSSFNSGTTSKEAWAIHFTYTYAFRYNKDTNVIEFRRDGVVLGSLAGIYTEDMYLRIYGKYMNISDIKYIDLSTAGTPEQYDDNYAKEVQIQPLKVADKDGVEQFEVDIPNGEMIQFDGFEIDNANKRITSRALGTHWINVSLSEGIDAVVASLPTDDGSFYVLNLIDDGTYNVSNQLPRRNLLFRGDNATTIDFTNVGGDIVNTGAGGNFTHAYDLEQGTITIGGTSTYDNQYQYLRFNCKNINLTSSSYNVIKAQRLDILADIVKYKSRAIEFYGNDNSRSNIIVRRFEGSGNTYGWTATNSNAFVYISFKEGVHTNSDRFELLSSSFLGTHYINFGNWSSGVQCKVVYSRTSDSICKFNNSVLVNCEFGDDSSGVFTGVIKSHSGDFIRAASSYNNLRLKNLSIITSCGNFIDRPIANTSILVENCTINLTNVNAYLLNASSSTTTYTNSILKFRGVNTILGGRDIFTANMQNTTNARFDIQGVLNLSKNKTFPYVDLLTSFDTIFGTKQKELTTNFTVSSDENKSTIFLNPTVPITITVDDSLPDNFECEFINISANDVTFVAGTGTLNSPDGLTLSQNKVATLLKRLNNNDYWLKGELA